MHIDVLLDGLRQIAKIVEKGTSVIDHECRGLVLDTRGMRSVTSIQYNITCVIDQIIPQPYKINFDMKLRILNAACDMFDTCEALENNVSVTFANAIKAAVIDLQEKFSFDYESSGIKGCYFYSGWCLSLVSKRLGTKHKVSDNAGNAHERCELDKC